MHSRALSRARTPEMPGGACHLAPECYREAEHSPHLAIGCTIAVMERSVELGEVVGPLVYYCLMVTRSLLVGFALLAALSCCRGYEIVPAEEGGAACPTVAC